MQEAFEGSYQIKERRARGDCWYFLIRQLARRRWKGESGRGKGMGDETRQKKAYAGQKTETRVDPTKTKQRVWSCNVLKLYCQSDESPLILNVIWVISIFKSVWTTYVVVCYHWKLYILYIDIDQSNYVISYLSNTELSNNLKVHSQIHTSLMAKLKLNSILWWYFKEKLKDSTPYKCDTFQPIKMFEKE